MDTKAKLNKLIHFLNKTNIIFSLIKELLHVWYFKWN